jgi:hypothetical protein
LSAKPTRAERPHLRRASVRSSVARGWGKAAAAGRGAVLVSGWRSAVTWRRLGDLVGHPSSVCSRRPPVSSSEPRSQAANTYRLAGGARRLYYIRWAARGPQLTSSPCARSAGRLNGGTRASWPQKTRAHAARAAVAAVEACSADAEAPRRAAPAPAEPMRQRVERAGAHRRGDAGGPESRCREGARG